MSKEGYQATGVPSEAELQNFPGRPSEERMKKGRVAVVECLQEIPCNPCEPGCRFGAIKIGENITALPCLDEDLCTGCGQCVPKCPGLAIFIVNKSYSETEATVDFPYEYLPLPEKGDTVEAADRAGRTVCPGHVLRVISLPENGGTNVISLAIPKEYADDVRGMKRLPRDGKGGY